MGKVIGIDLGTTKSSVAVIEGGRAVIIPNEMGERTIPSVVSFTNSKERLVGEEALRQAEANPKRTILSVKRHMGTDWTVNIDNEMFTAQEISAMILRRLRDNASVYLGENVTDAVITVPAHFNDIQRQATKDAGRIAGLNVLRIINEPTSAALAYGLKCSHPQKIMVFDLGGGTFDVSIIEIGDGIIEVLSTSGDDNFGGDDFDNIIVNHLLNVLKKDYKADIRKNASSYQRLLFAAKKAKKELSTEAVATISLPYLAKAQGKFIHFEYELTRAEFEALSDDLLDRIAGPVERALNDAGLAPSELGEVLLVGGSTRIPAVIKRVQQLTGISPSRSIHSDECVAKGAAIEGDILSNKELYSSKEASILLLDVTPMSLSIETVGGVSTRLVERNTTLPVKYSHVFTTAAQYQSEVEMHVLQGERPMAKDNKTIGRFKLTGIERTMQKAPRLEVTFDIDVNGILTVSASDLDAKRELSIFISANDKMSEDEIRQAVLNSESYVKADKLRKEASDVKKYANRVLERTGEALSNVGREIEREEKNKIKDACQTLRRLINRFDSKNMTESQMREIKNAIRDLEFVSADICWKSSMALRDSK